MNPFRKFVDWYVLKYHADDYIHTSKISKEIKRRIENAEERLKNDFDITLSDALESQQMKHDSEMKVLMLKHKVECDGFIAEIETMKKFINQAREMRRNVEELHFRVIERAKIIGLITEKNKNDRIGIVNDISASIGMIEKSELEIERLNKEIEDFQKKDEEALRG